MSRDTARKVLEIEAEAIRELIPRLDESFDRAVEMLLACTGRVVVTGMGKSGIIAQKISATLPPPAAPRSSSTPPRRSTATSAGS